MAKFDLKPREKTNLEILARAGFINTGDTNGKYMILEAKGKQYLYDPKTDTIISPKLKATDSCYGGENRPGRPNF